MNLKTLETVNLPPWATLKNLALATAGAFALSSALYLLWGMYALANGMIVAFICEWARALGTALSAAFFYVFWRKAR